MRYKTSETVRVYGYLPAGSAAVTIQIWSDGTELTVGLGTLLDDECLEEGTASGKYYWETSNIVTQPTSYTTYSYVMTEAYTQHTFSGKFCMGGWPDSVGTGGGGGTTVYRGGTTTVLEGETDDTELLKLRKQVKKMQDKLEGKKNGR